MPRWNAKYYHSVRYYLESYLHYNKYAPVMLILSIGTYDPTGVYYINMYYNGKCHKFI